MHNLSLKKTGIVILTALLFFSQAGCETGKKADRVAETSEMEVSPFPEETNDSEEAPKEVMGPMPQVTEAAEITQTPEPAAVSPIPEDFADGRESEGTLSPPSETTTDSVFGQSGTSEPQTDEKMQALLTSLAFPSGNGSWSVYVYNLAENTEGSINPQKMQAASLIKLFIMGAVYENYDLLISQYGQENVDGNLYSMITVSDNDAANTLVGYLGGGDGTSGMNVVNQYCSANGYSSTHMGRLLLQSNEFDDNYTSVTDCGNFLRRVYEGNKNGESPASAELSLLAAQTRRNKIPAQMPTGVSIANKTGELGDVENDAGIIYNTTNDLIIVFMSENLTEVGSAQNTIAVLSRQIYDYYNS